MYAIIGATGHVGGATARELLAAGAPVRVVVRDEVNGQDWKTRGAEVAVADLADQEALSAAFAGCRGVFAMLPTSPTTTDAEQRRLADTLAAAVADRVAAAAAAGEPVTHVVMLSSVGADLADGTGPVRWLHHLEDRLRATGTVLTAIRSSHFQEKVEDVLGAAIDAGIYPVFGDVADMPTPLIATRDVGAVAAQSLLAPPSASEVVDLDGPHYTERQVAEKLGALLGTELRVVTIPRLGWISALTDAGLPAPLAAEIAELHLAGERGLLRPRGDRTRRCTTEIDQTLRDLVPSQ
ncbi:NAD(P)H-binding protein [Jiangella asiatica]|uniref:NAD-dependent epimerase/dehydratase family protein n=1 Tax=Jiangella asiatica TaxID=2530372 RepID=A0A4R5DN26_9ACTN|nr:NAD(P)H-binding protein [Jiangella asiatica]TDE14937.1 NAD-dependent epimerase/dehydratase family protein [Jiangella asiatica]